LRFLRGQTIVHRDIKPQNLLLQPPNDQDIKSGHPPGIPVLQVADFGFARFLPQQSMAETLCGSPLVKSLLGKRYISSDAERFGSLYMAPEILRYEKYDAKADLWSVGAVLYEMATGKPPFRAQNPVELLRKIERGEDRIRFPDERDAKQDADQQKAGKAPPRAVAEDIKRLCRALLKRNPVERMGFDMFFEAAAAVAADVPADTFAPKSLSEPPANDRISREVVAAMDQQEGAFARPSPTPFPTKKAAVPGASDRIHSSPAVVTTAAAATPARRQPVFPPKYVVGGSTYPATTVLAKSKPVDIVEGVKAKDFALRHQRGDTPPDLAAGSRLGILLPFSIGITELISIYTSIEDNSPSHPPTPKSDIGILSSAPSSYNNAGYSNEDSVVGREYVVVEKGTVEINALADGEMLFHHDCNHRIT
jgi:serine/threonine-protein kinase ULK/ATG1